MVWVGSVDAGLQLQLRGEQGRVGAGEPDPRRARALVGQRGQGGL